MTGPMSDPTRPGRVINGVFVGIDHDLPGGPPVTPPAGNPQVTAPRAPADDLIARLRAGSYAVMPHFGEAMLEAADRLEVLEAENDRLRDALEDARIPDDAQVVKPGQACTADGVVCDLMPFSSFPITIDSIGADGASHRYRSLKYTLRPVAGGSNE